MLGDYVDVTYLDSNQYVVSRNGVATIIKGPNIIVRYSVVGTHNGSIKIKKTDGDNMVYLLKQGANGNWEINVNKNNSKYTVKFISHNSIKQYTARNWISPNINKTVLTGYHPNTYPMVNLPNGTLALLKDGNVEIWDTNLLRSICKLYDGIGIVTDGSKMVVASEKYLFVSYLDNTSANNDTSQAIVKRWNLETGECMETFSLDKCYYNSLRMIAIKGDKIVISYYDKLIIYQIVPDQPYIVKEFLVGGIDNICEMTDGNILIFTDITFEIWDTNSCSTIKIIDHDLDNTGALLTINHESFLSTKSNCYSVITGKPQYNQKDYMSYQEYHIPDVNTQLMNGNIMFDHPISTYDKVFTSGPVNRKKYELQCLNIKDKSLTTAITISSELKYVHELYDGRLLTIHSGNPGIVTTIWDGQFDQSFVDRRNTKAIFNYAKNDNHKLISQLPREIINEVILPLL